MTYAAAVLADAPDVLWEMQETSGTVMADSSGNGNDGTYVNAPTLGAASLIAAESGLKSVTFDGPNDHALWANTVLTRAANWSVSGWIRPDLGSYAEGQLWGTNYDGSNVNESLRVNGSKFIAAFFNGSWREAQAVSNFASGTVYHVAETWDGTSLKLYINGVLITTTTPGGSMTGGTIGTFYLANKWDSTDRPPCGLSHVAIWDTVLTAGQVANHYAGAVGLFVPAPPMLARAMLLPAEASFPTPISIPAPPMLARAMLLPAQPIVPIRTPIGVMVIDPSQGWGFDIGTSIDIQTRETAVVAGSQINRHAETYPAPTLVDGRPVS